MRRNGELGRKGNGGNSSGHEKEDCWMQIWQLRVPPRVKSFLWKYMHNILPTRDRLRRKEAMVRLTLKFKYHWTTVEFFHGVVDNYL
ncbi:hypothetical protein LIER_18285 [Lithospermum erythrorhizon]|uniref:Reverse transcriptase zinc-binding domain-containing protein n=1 Tax=Lithospermum erythrorhizon TaxID=34254 RepID=A0AAV3QFT6_LITER